MGFSIQGGQKRLTRWSSGRHPAFSLIIQVSWPDSKITGIGCVKLSRLKVSGSSHRPFEGKKVR